MPQMSPMVWIGFPFVMCFLFIVVVVFMSFSSDVIVNEGMLVTRMSNIKW